MRKIIIILLMLLSLCSCSNTVKVDEVESSDTVYVRKIENLKEDFIFGADVSSVISLENSGVKYYDYNGEEEDIFKVLKESGLTHIRVRVWNDPYDSDGNSYGGGNCDINNAIEIGKRATKYGLKLIVDFHYSDFWADPNKQMCPKAWQNLTIEEKGNALYEYTCDCLKKLKNNNVDVDIVTLGNETNGAMAGEKNWYNIVYVLMTNGSKAVREVLPKARIAVHFANPENKDQYLTYASKLAYYVLDYDIFATSYYPYWHGTLENLNDTLSTIAEKYNKQVMVMETSYAYTEEDSDYFANTISSGTSITKNYSFSEQGQVNCLLDIIETINKTTNGIGVCYWEPAWLTVKGNSYEENFAIWEKYGSGWASTYASEYDPDDAGKYYGGSAVDNQALFDATGHPLESLKVFALCKKGNIIEVKADSVLDSNITIDLNDDIVLPSTVTVLMNDASKQEVEVTWDELDTETMKNNGPATYTVYGKTKDGLSATCYVKMIEYNYLNNYSFEEDANKVAIPSYWQVIDNKNASELYVEDKSADSLTGNKHFHFWSSGNNTVDFDLFQVVTDLKAGTYKFSISIMGGDAGVTNIYSYVKINGKIVSTKALTITSYNNWDTQTINGIEYNGTDTLEVGIHVSCAGSGSGAWGKIDDALLNSEK